jgi:TonB-linked SusC/RagA family outer membrane protein
MRSFQRLLWKSVAFTSFLLLLLLCNVANAQTNKVTGKVTGENKEPVIGATVKVKGGSEMTTTKDDGTFSLPAPAGASLEISAVGFTTLTVPADFTQTMSVSLAINNASLGEVVVVGYGTAKKGSLTGAVSTVNAKTFQDRGPIANPLAALQGQVPGVAVTRSSAQPGRESWNFLIRGNSSTNGTEPLVIVDGLTLPNTAALNSFNPADIENISFLKDAAAASIYGSRAASGVVIITTKRAKAGKASIQYNGSLSKKKIGLLPELVDIKGWGPMMEEAKVTDGVAPNDNIYKYGKLAQYAVANNITYLKHADAAAWLNSAGLGSAGFYTDVKDFVFFPGTMQDVLWGDAVSNEHQLSVAAKGEKSGYRISLGYLNDGSLLQVGNNSNKRYNLRLTHDYQFSSKLKLESNFSLEKNDIIQPSNIGAVLNNGIQPGMPQAAMNGKPYVWGSGIGNATTNNIAKYGGDGKELNTRLNSSLNLTYNFTKNLKAVTALGYYFLNTDYRTRENVINWYDYTGTQLISSLSPSNSNRSFYQRANRKEAYYNVNAYLEYARTFNADHDVKMMAGTQYERQEVASFMAKTFDVVADVPSSLSLSTGDGTSKTVAEDQYHVALAGYFGRFNYAYKNKYLFEINGRYDGTSRFQQDNRWQLFYGLSGGWRISQEPFMENISFVNDLKLRASWGNVGNQYTRREILYEFIQFMNLNYSTGPGSAAYPIIGNSPVVRVSPGGIPAPDRTWERVQTTNLAMDFSVLNSRLSGSFEVFRKNNDNLLLPRTLPAVLGADAPTTNNGKLRTNGWDLSLTWSDRIGKVTYRIGGNISDYKTRLVYFGGQKLIKTDNRGLNNVVEGYPINSYFGLEYAGRIQTDKELQDYRAYIKDNNIGMPSGAAAALPNTRLALGDNMFRDLNGDGKITFPDDAKFLGTDDPRLIYSMNAGLEWNGFDLNVIFQGVGKRTIVRDGNWRIPAAVTFQAQNKAFENAWWTPERTGAYLPRISSTGAINNYNYFPSDWVKENGAYLRLKNLVIGYTLPAMLTQKARIQKLRVYFSGNDLWERTKIRDGWDPEATRNVNNSGDLNNNNVSTNSGRYPFYRYLTAGINVTF